MTLKNTCFVVDEFGYPIATIGDKEVSQLHSGKGSGVIRKAAHGAGCYMLLNPTTGDVKVGHSQKLRERWRTLETQSGSPLFPLLLWSTPNRESAEKWLHSELDSHRKLGEWFDGDGVREWLTKRFRVLEFDGMAEHPSVSRRRSSVSVNAERERAKITNLQIKIVDYMRVHTDVSRRQVYAALTGRYNRHLFEAAMGLCIDSSDVVPYLNGRAQWYRFIGK